jgi:ABC-type lipoprotein release transport system permease subunit
MATEMKASDPNLTDEKEMDKNTEFVKEEHQETRDYIFQKNKITKTAFFIVLFFLIVLVIGLVVSGVLFEAPATNVNP